MKTRAILTISLLMIILLSAGLAAREVTALIEQRRQTNLAIAETQLRAEELRADNLRAEQQLRLDYLAANLSAERSYYAYMATLNAADARDARAFYTAAHQPESTWLDRNSWWLLISTVIAVGLVVLLWLRWRPR